jgi:hypothetical protein
MHHRQLHYGRLVAFGAGNGAMRTNQREIRSGMIELRHILPFLDRMAERASDWLAALVKRSHTLSELAFVDVLVATRATQLNKVVDRGLGSVSRFVAFVAWHRRMSIGEREV